MTRVAILFLVIILPLRAVTPIDASGLITPAHYFNFEGKTVTFKPQERAASQPGQTTQGEGLPHGNGYMVSVSKVHPPGDFGKLLEHPAFKSHRSFGWRLNLPFPFPYAGITWHEIYVNSAGNLTFERPEAELYAERDTWAAGTVQMVADSLNNRSAAGQEKMICALWGLNSQSSRIFLREGPGEFVVTWQVERYIWFGEGYHPLGPNLFQARLTPDGAIEFSYHKVSEKDGIVGLFTGAGGDRKLGFLVPVEDSPEPRIDLRYIEAGTTGTILRFTFVARDAILTSVPEGRLWYRIFLNRDKRSCEIGFAINGDPDNAHPYMGRDCEGTPGVRLQGSRLNLYVSASTLQTFLNPGLKWHADVLWYQNPDSQLNHRAGNELFHPSAEGWMPAGTMSGYHEGNIFEVFHYPQIDKNVLPELRYIYQRVSPQDDFAVVLTDFRIDDLHNHQGSTGGGYNVPIQGIGDRLAEVIENAHARMGSAKLQVATGPIYLGPRFDEFLEDEGHHYKNYANAVGWMAHELGHRWGMALKFHNPYDRNLGTLHPEGGHWNNFLNTASVYSVWKMFSDKPYSEKSQMEGHVFHELPDGMFQRERPPWNLPTGFSALDLYAMGMIGPEEVPDTFLIHNPKQVGPGLFSGQKVPVRIADVIAASGQRAPDARHAQKEFILGMYLLHEGGRPPDAMKLRQAEGIEKSLVDYFYAATGGRMHVVPSRAMPQTH